MAKKDKDKNGRPEDLKQNEDLSDQERAEAEEKKTIQEAEARGESERKSASHAPEDEAPENEASEDETPRVEDQPQNGSSGQKLFPVVGIGASAGGLEALEQFISGLAEKAASLLSLSPIPIRITPPACRNCSGAIQVLPSCLSKMK
ncbi:MAG: hypothetical protein U5K27_04980 [Desulfotignum sp.]|nr:hypothetical protein [Desulfotignum sp.]